MPNDIDPERAEEIARIVQEAARDLREAKDLFRLQIHELCEIFDQQTSRVLVLHGRGGSPAWRSDQQAQLYNFHISIRDKTAGDHDRLQRDVRVQVELIKEKFYDSILKNANEIHHIAHLDQHEHAGLMAGTKAYVEGEAIRMGDEANAKIAKYAELIPDPMHKRCVFCFSLACGESCVDADALPGSGIDFRFFFSTYFLSNHDAPTSSFSSYSIHFLLRKYFLLNYFS
eukprot:SAG11_NODE_4117_length_2059_cov_1.364796_1_plen_228_part_10